MTATPGQSPGDVTVVSGLPRSGTTMMMRIIDAGGIPALTDGVRPADSDNPHGYYEYEPVKKTREDSSWLDGADGRVVKLVHLLLLDLPTDRPYRVVFMRRSLDEVVMSQNVMLARAGKTSDPSLSDERLAEVFRAQLAGVEKYLAEHECFRVLYVSYHDVIQKPANAAATVNAFLGGGLDEARMREIVDPSLYHQRGQDKG